MRQFTLSIAEPCHEDWAAMNPDGRGRYCASCCKTVIDFSAMTDAQLVDFFRKPTGNVCGRLRADQMARPIAIPAKAFPWKRYLFRVGWPAFVLVLQSCGNEINQRVEPRDERKELNLVGVMVANIDNTQTSADTVSVIPSVDSLKPVERVLTNQNNLTVDLLSVPAAGPADMDSLAGKIPRIEDQYEKEIVCIDPLEMRSIPDSVPQSSLPTVFPSTLVGFVGGVSVEYSRERPRKIKRGSIIPRKKKAAPATPDFTVYPNPVSAGSTVTISLDEMWTGNVRIDLLTEDRRLLQTTTQKQGITVMDIRIPSTVHAGICYVRISAEGQPVQTKKIVVIQ